MKLTLALLIALLSTSFAADAQECDWTVNRTIDPMTDNERCYIRSSNAAITLFADKDRISFITGSAYARHGGSDGLRLRVDDNAAISISPRGRSTTNYHDDARNALREILTGTRLRTSYLDYPTSRSGDAQICTLPQLLEDCGAPLERLKDTRSQAEKITEMTRRRRR